LCFHLSLKDQDQDQSRCIPVAVNWTLTLNCQPTQLTNLMPIASAAALTIPKISTLMKDGTINLVAGTFRTFTVTPIAHVPIIGVISK
jgi:hypothetical protein